MNENEKALTDENVKTEIADKTEAAPVACQKERTPTLFERYGEVISLTIGESAVVLLTVLGFVIYGLLGGDVPLYKAILGALLGALVTIGNMLVLSLSVNRAINKYLELRGTREMSDEEAERFANENGVIIQAAITRSYILRSISMVAVLVGALLIPVFNVVATVIPLAMYRPIMYITELIKKRGSGK